MADAASKSRVRVVTDPDAAALLTNPRGLRVLGPFLTGPQTLSTAASTLRRRPSSVAYWLPRYLAAQLIEPAPQPGRGRWYRATADEFFVPYAALREAGEPSITATARARAVEAFHQSFDRAESDAQRWGLAITVLDGVTHLRTQVPAPATTPARRRSVDIWTDLRLTRDDAAQLCGELLAIEQRYRRRQHRRGRLHRIHFGLTPA